MTLNRVVKRVYEALIKGPEIRGKEEINLPNAKDLCDAKHLAGWNTEQRT